MSDEPSRSAGELPEWIPGPFSLAPDFRSCRDLTRIQFQRLLLEVRDAAIHEVTTQTLARDGEAAFKARAVYHAAEFALGLLTRGSDRPGGYVPRPESIREARLYLDELAIVTAAADFDFDDEAASVYDFPVYEDEADEQSALEAEQEKRGE